MDAFLKWVAPILQRRIARFIRDHNDVEDVLQETLKAITENLDQLNPDANLVGWCVGIATNKVSDFYRKRRQVLSLGEEFDPPDVSANEEKRLVELRECLKLIMSRLPVELCQIASLWATGITLEQIGQELGLTVDALKHKRVRTRKMAQQIAREVGCLEGV